MTTTTLTLNDVDIAAVGALADAITADPVKADTTWSTSVSWDGGFRTTTNIRDFAPISTDEPTGLGGTDTAPNPVEQLLGALGSCLAIGYAANATAAGIRIDDLRIDVEGDLNLKSFLGLEPGHAGFDTLRATVQIETDADDAAIVALHDRVVATSPVGHTLGGAIPLTVDLK
ncbi:MAG: OsmC family protein [Actinomycetota bacterium]